MTIEFLKQIETKVPRLIYKTQAYAKLQGLMSTTHAKDKEFGFVGLIEKQDTDYIVEDVFVFPQLCTATFFETDDDKYPEWINKTFKDVKDRKKIRLQGHSHVNMATNPSGTDQQQILKTLDEVKDYYIQLIINHKHQDTCNIYSKEDNLIYKNVDQYILVNKVLINLSKMTISNLDEVKTNPRINNQLLMFDSGLSIVLDGPYYTVNDEILVIDFKTKTTTLLQEKNYNQHINTMCRSKTYGVSYNKGYGVSRKYDDDYDYDNRYSYADYGSKYDSYYGNSLFDEHWYKQVEKPELEKKKRGRPKKNES